MNIRENKENGWMLPRSTLLSELSIANNELSRSTQYLDRIRMRINRLLNNLVGRTYIEVMSKSMSPKRYIKVTDITDSGRIVVNEVSEPCDNPIQGGGSGETSITIDNITDPMMWEEVPNEDYNKAVEKVIEELRNITKIKPKEYTPLPEISIL